jgi:hypothetical protein
MKITVVLEDDSGRRFEGQAVLEARGQNTKVHSGKGTTRSVAVGAPPQAEARSDTPACEWLL